jgi:hypothetical protein
MYAGDKSANGAFRRRSGTLSGVFLVVHRRVFGEQFLEGRRPRQAWGALYRAGTLSAEARPQRENKLKTEQEAEGLTKLNQRGNVIQ